MISVDKVFVLHVKKGYEDRAVHMENQLKKFGIEFEYILDYDIEDLTDEDLDKYYRKDNTLDNPNLSIGMKHINVLNKIVANRYNLTLVFEDDVFLDKSFNEIVENAIKELKGKGEGNVVSLGNAGNLYVDKKEIKKQTYLYKNRKHRAADSYIIDLKAAERRLEWLKRNKTVETAGHMYNTIDNEVGNNIFWLHPTIVEQGSQNGFMKSSVSRNKFLHRFRWLWRDFNKKHLK